MTKLWQDCKQGDPVYDPMGRPIGKIQNATSVMVTVIFTDGKTVDVYGPTLGKKAFCAHGRLVFAGRYETKMPLRNRPGKQEREAGRV